MPPRQRVTAITPTASTDEPGTPSLRQPLDASSSAPASKSAPLVNGIATQTPPSSRTKKVVDIRERDRHDIFNLLALPLLLAAALANWDVELWIRERTTLQESWHDAYIYQLIATIMAYFIVDLVWVSLIPSCVKSPGTIVKHHIAALVYNCAPIWYPEYRCFMGVVLSVELNTWFLIMRRVLFLRQDSPYVTQQLRDLIDYAFYTSWIIIRVVGYNMILWALFPLLVGRFQSKDEDVFFPTLFVATQTALNLMNLKWTYDLFTPIIKRNLFQSGDGDNTDKDHTL